MTYEDAGCRSLDYFPCRYGTSKLIMRGPRRRLQGDYVAFLGGTETYGRFIPTPYPMATEHLTGMRSVNLGCVNAGIDAFLNDPSLIRICRNARVTVIQLMGAQNMSNRWYRVHPRRNDRFLHASQRLCEASPGIDFTDFNFTRHMLNVLERTDPETFSAVRRDLKAAWVRRMSQLMQAIGGRVVLLWLAGRAPDKAGGLSSAEADPLFVDRSMISRIADKAAHRLDVIALRQEVDAGLSEMVYAPLERPAAEEMLGPVVHRRTAELLGGILPGFVD